MRRRDVIGLCGWCGLCLAVGFTGSWATATSLAGWYANIGKLSWTPPGWVFAPVWTLLYLLMGVSAWLVWKPGGFSSAKIPLSLFLVQLGFNAAWSWLFFGWRNPLAGLIDIVLLWIAIVATIVGFHKYSRPASWLMLPYLSWVSFAALLNLAIFRMN